MPQLNINSLAIQWFFFQKNVLSFSNIFSYRNINTLRPEQDHQHFPDNILILIFFIKNFEFQKIFDWNVFLSV